MLKISYNCVLCMPKQRARLVDKVDTRHRVTSAPFAGNWNTRGTSGMHLGLSSSTNPRPSGFRALGVTRQSNRGFRPPYALSQSRLPAQYRSIFSALLAIGAVGTLPPVAVRTLARSHCAISCRYGSACL